MCYALDVLKAFFTRTVKRKMDLGDILHFYNKNGFYCVTFQKWVAKVIGFAIINAWQHFGNRKSASHNK